MGQKTRIVNGIPVTDNPEDASVKVKPTDPVPDATDGPDSTTVVTADGLPITGVNLGDGAGIYAGANGNKHEKFEFRSIMAGAGIDIQTDHHPNWKISTDY